MQYNSEANNFDCVSEILKICKATTGKYPLKDITRRFNFALDRYLTLAFKANGTFSFDDINQSSPPIDTQNIVSGTNRYKFSDFAAKIFQLLKLELVDNNGNVVFITPESLQDLDRQKLTFAGSYSTAIVGVPTNYLKLGDYIYLRATPNYNATAGMKAYFNRPASYMVYTDTIKVPGVPIMHHQYLCRMAAQPYLDENTMSNAGKNQSLILQDEAEIILYFSRREKPISRRTRANVEDNK